MILTTTNAFNLGRYLELAKLYSTPHKQIKEPWRVCWESSRLRAD